MRILIYGDIGGSGGYHRYCKGLLSVEDMPSDLEIWFISSENFYSEISPINSRIKVYTHKWIGSPSKIKRYLWYFLIFPLLVLKITPDIEFYMSGQIRSYFRKSITVATCHNLLLFDQGQLNKIVDKNEYSSMMKYRKNQIQSYLRSSGVIFLSDYSKEIVMTQVKNIASFSVIPHGLDSIFKSKNKRSYDLSQSINVLYVSPIYDYKNQDKVIQGIKIARESTGLNIKLRLVGGGTPEAINKIKALIERERLSEDVLLIDFIENDLLLREYELADIFIFASSCETFGITLLEAMGARLPIACSNKTGLSHILNDAGEYFDPEDPHSISSSITNLIKSEELRRHYGEMAYQYSLSYSWDRCAHGSYEFMRSLVVGKAQ